MERRDFKYTNIEIDFPKTRKSPARRFYAELSKLDPYFGYSSTLYSDGIRVDSLKNPWVSDEDIARIAEKLGIRCTRIEFEYYHPWQDPYSDQGLNTTLRTGYKNGEYFFRPIRIVEEF